MRLSVGDLTHVKFMRTASFLATRPTVAGSSDCQLVTSYQDYLLPITADDLAVLDRLALNGLPST